MAGASESGEHLGRNGREVRDSLLLKNTTLSSANAGNWRAYELWLCGEPGDALSGAHGGG